MVNCVYKNEIILTLIGIQIKGNCCQQHKVCQPANFIPIIASIESTSRVDCQIPIDIYSARGKHLWRGLVSLWVGKGIHNFKAVTMETMKLRKSFKISRRDIFESWKFTTRSVFFDFGFLSLSTTSSH